MLIKQIVNLHNFPREVKTCDVIRFVNISIKRKHAVHVQWQCVRQINYQKYSESSFLINILKIFAGTPCLQRMSHVKTQKNEREDQESNQKQHFTFHGSHLRTQTTFSKKSLPRPQFHFSTN